MDSRIFLSVALEDSFTEVLNVQTKIVGFELAVIFYFEQQSIVSQNGKKSSC